MQEARRTYRGRVENSTVAQCKWTQRGWWNSNGEDRTTTRHQEEAK